jgi:hypothetical protein
MLKRIAGPIKPKSIEKSSRVCSYFSKLPLEHPNGNSGAFAEGLHGGRKR